MKTKISRCFVALLASMIVLLQSGAYAADSKKAPKDALKKSEAKKTTVDAAKQGAGFNKLADQLKLTAEQRDKLSKDRENLSLRSKDLREKVRLARTELKAEFDKPGLDKAKIDSLVVKIKDLVGQQIQSRVDSIMTMKETLSPEQFQQMTNTVTESMSSKRHNNGNPAQGGDKIDPDNMM